MIPKPFASFGRGHLVVGAVVIAVVIGAAFLVGGTGRRSFAVDSPSNLFDVLGSTLHRVRTFVIGFGDQAEYTNTIGWQALGENYNPHLGCRGGPAVENDDPDVRVDDYHNANPNGAMLAYENLVMTFTAPTAAVARDETSWVHVNDPARLRVIPGNGRLRVVWSDDGRGFGGAWGPDRTFLRGEDVALTGYHVYRALSKTGQYTRITSSPVAYKKDTPSTHLDTGMEFVDTNVTNGTTYWYKVVSVEAASELAFSEPIAGVPTATSPTLAVSSVDARESVVFNTGVWNYTLTFVVEGSPDSVTLSFDRDRDRVIENNSDPALDETILLSQTPPGSGKYVFTTTQTPSAPSSAPGWGFFVTVQKGATTVRMPSTNWYTTTINNRAISRQYGWLFFNHDNTNVRTWFQSEMAEHVSANERCDGTFGDVFVFSMGDDTDAPLPSFDRAAYTASLKNFVDLMDNQNGSMVLNGLPTVAELATGIGNVGDGFLSEGFGVGYGTRPWTGWIRDMMTSAITLVKQYRQPVFLGPRPRDDAAGAAAIKDREYGFAAYNIVREDRTYYYVNDEAPGRGVYDTMGDYPEYAVHLGQPVDNTADNTVSAYYINGNNRLLRRRFVNGVVVMNIYQPPDGGQSRTIDLGGSYYRVRFNGGKVRHGGTVTVDTQPVTSVTLGPTEAAIFVSTPDLPQCVENWSCTAWGSCINGQQTRSCSDQHDCGTVNNRPPLIRACTPEETKPTTDPESILDATIEDVVVGTGAGGGPQVRRFSADGQLRSQFFAYTRTVTSGLSVSSGDVNGDGVAEVVTGTGPGAAPRVRVHTPDGRLLAEFMSDTKASRNGVSVTVADLDGDGVAEVVTVPARGSSVVRVYGYDRETGRYRRSLQYLASAPTYRGGATVAAGDFDQDGRDEIVVAPNAGAPRLKVLRYVAERHELKQRSSFTVFPSHFTTGVSVTTGDFDGDGKVEIAAGSGPGRDPVVRFFRSDGKRRWGFLSGAKTFRGGIIVSAVQADDDPADELITAPWAKGAPTITIRDISGRMDKMTIKRRMPVYSKTFQGGVRVTGLEITQ